MTRETRTERIERKLDEMIEAQTQLRVVLSDYPEVRGNVNTLVAWRANLNGKLTIITLVVSTLITVIVQVGAWALSKVAIHG